MEAADTLGAFLRARREQLSPEEAGLPSGDRRRVAGLRREEVAMLAGISSEYYLRIEQGRDQHPSNQVLEGISVALQLDDDALSYLYRLAHPEPQRKRRRRSESVRPALQALIDSWPLTPAYIHGASGIVLAANQLAIRLSPVFTPGENPLRSAFLDPEMRRLYVDWEDMTAKAVAGLRSTLTPELSTPDVSEVIGELSIRSERFRTLWSRRDVRQKTSGATKFLHPLVGLLELHYEKLLLPDTQQLVVLYRAEPNSVSEERLSLLASL